MSLEKLADRTRSWPVFKWLMLYEEIVNCFRTVFRMSVLEAQNHLLHIICDSKWVLVHGMWTIFEAALPKFSIALEKLVSSFLAHTELGADISNLPAPISACSDESFSF